MKLIPIALFLFAGSSFVAAAPIEELTPLDEKTTTTTTELEPQGCPNGWSFCGRCNGTSCKVAGLNYSCGYGTSCTQQSGGGDGALCGTYGVLQGPYYCPGHH
ncbi:pyridoxamine-phosphate oxidase [Talaromyces marneffei ATCC 18224]|uniref:Uncharacterized protein n=1 Tax=Talaromyces marneffei PM1 TaxID=1077442 RepID=A0A093VLG0_TALMA|nr:uncharacterized protein EYB26_006371 [Talaromyces marneffei]KAE8552441.1 hypothetical protein EYB25_006335 [Talaromyces marneffei]QGA18686.1 hypothetical protein EYB26_006371 [Talaromyces marneffei]